MRITQANGNRKISSEQASRSHAKVGWKGGDRGIEGGMEGGRGRQDGKSNSQGAREKKECGYERHG